jgi:hypothetical protein
MFTHHEIKIEDSRDFVVRTTLASNSDERKALVVVVTPYTNSMKYEVEHRKTIVYSGDNLQDAIDTYNDIYEHSGSVRTKIVRTK